MSHIYDSSIRKPLVIGDKSYHDVTVDVAAPVEGLANKHWWIVFTIALTAFLCPLRDWVPVDAPPVCAG